MATAKKIKTLTNYVGEVGVYELSKGIKKGALTFKYVVISKFKPVSGAQNINIWLSDAEGEIKYIDPLKVLEAKDHQDALKQLGYTLQ